MIIFYGVVVVIFIFGYHILLLIVSGLLYPQLRCIKYSACFVFCLFYFNRQQVI